MEQKRCLIFFGEVLWDIVPKGAQPGGAAANAAVMAHACGANALLVSAVGADELGRAMLTVLKQRNVPTDGISVSDEWPTGSVDVGLTADGQPSYTIHTDVAWDNISVNDSVMIATQTARAFYFGSLAQRSSKSRNNLYLLLDQLPKDCLRFFDINLRTPLPSLEVVVRSLGYTDVLKLNNDELPILAQWLNLPAEENAFSSGLFASFPIRTILLTKGAEGAVVFERDRTSSVPAPRVDQLVDTIGAGDAFSAGFLTAILNGDGIQQAASSGTAIAAKVCCCSGAWLPLVEVS